MTTFLKRWGLTACRRWIADKLENHFRVELPDYELQGVSDFRTLAGRIQAQSFVDPAAIPNMPKMRL